MWVRVGGVVGVGCVGVCGCVWVCVGVCGVCGVCVWVCGVCGSRLGLRLPGREAVLQLAVRRVRGSLCGCAGSRLELAVTQVPILVAVKLADWARQHTQWVGATESCARGYGCLRVVGSEEGWCECPTGFQLSSLAALLLLPTGAKDGMCHRG